jgi:hypothetical protein
MAESHISRYQWIAMENHENTHPDEQVKEKVSADANYITKMCA